MLEIKAFRYHTPLVRPFVSGAGSWTEREGVFLTLTAGGYTAWGEAAPLPGISTDSLEDVTLFLARNGKKIRSFLTGRIEGVDSSPDELTDLPSLQFAIDTLMTDWISQSKKRPINRLLFNNTRRRFPVNATLPTGKNDLTIEQAHLLWDEGFRTFKLKVGIRFDHEYELLRRLRQELPGATIRIDANQSWSAEEAETHLARLRDLKIEFCEEPVFNPGQATLRRVMQYSGIPLALDESLNRCQTGESAGKWMETAPAEIAVIKPMVFGSFKKIFETYRVSVTHNYRVIFTASLETGIGRMMTAFFAAGLSSPDMANGLATGGLLKLDVWKDKSYINDGYFSLPENYGLGQKFRSGVNQLALSPLVI